MDKSYARRIAGVRQLLHGMKVYGDKLEKWGITPEFINNITTLYNQANVEEQQKNILKANARQLTAAHNQLMRELESHCALVKKLVRLVLPKETWLEFGFRKGEYAVKHTAKTVE